MFLICLLLGTAGDQLARWWERSSSRETLTLAVRSGQRGMRIQNLTDSEWSGCVVTLEGGWQSRPFAIDAGGVQRLGYQTFLAGALPQGDRPSGFTRAFHETSVRCRDDAGHWQMAEVR